MVLNTLIEFVVALSSFAIGPFKEKRLEREDHWSYLHSPPVVLCEIALGNVRSAALWGYISFMFTSQKDNASPRLKVDVH